jgi:hypothetical protein
MRRTLLVLACVLTGHTFPSLAADELTSGPQPGKTVGSFSPLNVTGPDAGERECLV